MPNEVVLALFLTVVGITPSAHAQRSGPDPAELPARYLDVSALHIETARAAPTTVIDRREIDASGLASVGDLLQDLPWQSNAINTSFNNGGDGSTRINLRGLGTGQTLVLVNGRRHVAGGTGANGTVDVNAIPLTIVERIEVYAADQSARYGSGAAAGVVNIVTYQQFSGAQASAYRGSTPDGRGAVHDVSARAGMIGERGHVLFSAGYFEQGAIGAGERELSQTDRIYDWFESAVEQREIWFDDLSTATPDGFYRIFPGGGGPTELYNYQPENHLITPQQRYHAFATGQRHLSERAELYFEGSYLHRTSEQKLAPTPLFTIVEGITVAEDNLYNPEGVPIVDVRRRMVEAGNRRFVQKIATLRLVTGARGRLGESFGRLRDWRWNLAYNYGRTAGTVRNTGALVLDRTAEALGPSFIDAAGTPRCGTPDNPGRPECVPLDLFSGAGTITPDMLGYLTYTGIAQGASQMKSWTLDAGGTVLKTPWGGDVGLTVGLEYRAEAGEYTPDPHALSGNTTGNARDITRGEIDVFESFAHLQIAPFSGQRRGTIFDLSARNSQYSTAGNHSAWNAAAHVPVAAGVSARATLSNGFRAPTISDLYQGQTDSFPAVVDPCDTGLREPNDNESRNCADDGLAGHVDGRTQYRAIRSGNDQLQPERIRTATAGLVYQPPVLPGLSLSVDYFDIAVDDTIGHLGAAAILDNCYDRPPDQRSDCHLIIRGPLGAITRIDDSARNGGGRQTAGVDLAVRYRHRTNSGQWRHSLRAAWLRQYDARRPDGHLVVGKGVYDLGAFPAWRATLSSEWRGRALSAGVNLRYIGAFTECSDNDCQRGAELNEWERAALSRQVARNLIGDVFLGYTLRSELGQTQLAIGVNNAFDQAPSAVYNGFVGNSDAATYDYMGRFLYLRLTQRF